MKILFIHPNFPGQFRHLATHMAQQPGHQVVGLGDHDQVARQQGSTPGVILRGYRISREPAPQTHHYLRAIETNVLRGQATLRECQELKRLGFIPDLIVAHAGWGDLLYVREIFPRSKVIGYFEFYYKTSGADIGFDAEFPVSLDNRCEVHTKNLTHLLSWQSCDHGWSPTHWQASLFPVEMQARISVIHEGVDTQQIHGNPQAIYTLPNGKTLTRNDEVLTMVNRNMEPYRGFHVFMRSLPEIQRRRPRAETIIVGADNDINYGNRPIGKTWREALLAEVGADLDLNRIHFVGQLPHAEYLRVLQVSRAHMYLTYPFILSWSMLEAMACECLLIGSDTPPVSEVIRHEENGLLFDFFDRLALIEYATEALANPRPFDHLRQQARQTVVAHYDLMTVCLSQQLALMSKVMG